MHFTLSVPNNFNFWRTVYSHGWCSLPPFRVIKETRRLCMAVVVPPEKAFAIGVEQPSRGRLAIAVDTQEDLTPDERKNLVSQVKTSLRLDEDLSGFYAEARTKRAFRWIPKLGAGRLLRAPTVFEDVVKMICTTNCTWELTEVMVENLCRKLGKEVGDNHFSFPRPEALADVTEGFVRKEIRAGYRSPYMLELSRRVAEGEINLELWRQCELPTEELYEEVCAVKGVGPYAAGNILKLLGRYDYLALDSWCRKKFFEVHKNGRKVSDRAIERFYEPFGKWKGLFFWLDMTKDWYEHTFTF